MLICLISKFQKKCFQSSIDSKRPEMCICIDQVDQKDQLKLFDNFCNVIKNDICWKDAVMGRWNEITLSRSSSVVVQRHVSAVLPPHPPQVLIQRCKQVYTQSPKANGALFLKMTKRLEWKAQIVWHFVSLLHKCIFAVFSGFCQSKSTVLTADLHNLTLLHIFLNCSSEIVI